MAETLIIEILEGSGEPPSVELRPGVELSPLGIGSEGSWRVQGHGVLPVHAYLYFNGHQLFLQSANERAPAFVNGGAVGRKWTQVVAPCSISIAGVELGFRSVGGPSVAEANEEPETLEPVAPADDDQTVAAPPPKSSRGQAMPRPFAPGAFAARGGPESTGSDSETEVVPLGETPAQGAPIARPAAHAPVRPAAGTHWAGGATPPARPPPHASEEVVTFEQELKEPSTIEVPTVPPAIPLESMVVEPPPNRPPPGLLNVPPPPLAPAPKGMPFRERAAKDWRETSPIKKAIVILMPLLVPAVWIIFGDEPPSARRGTGQTQGSSGVPSGTLPGTSVTSSGSAPPAIASATTGLPTRSGASTNSPPIDPTAVGPLVTRPKSPPPSLSDGGMVEGGAPANADRRERTAADYVATGQYALAAQLYDHLAVDHPENPAFHEASRILRSKIDAGIR